MTGVGLAMLAVLVLGALLVGYDYFGGPWAEDDEPWWPGGDP